MSGRTLLDWGAAGARHLPREVGVAVVVDVLSFTTTVGVACERGMTVLPYQYAYDSAQDFADDHDAVLATRRDRRDRHDRTSISLSPESIRRCVDPPRRLVLPSPNGSTISRLLRADGHAVIAASLRNADAVAAHVQRDHPDTVVAVIAAGEQWEDGSLRPAVEDLWGAGAVLDALAQRGRTDLSPEAWATVHAWRGVAVGASEALHDTVSGRELEALGFVDDVRVAGEIGASEVVPVMDGENYLAAR
ncbi:2-phosphosulfolactate phosphatase [Williamsia phyllosphaerae]|uniref:Probable 2-phosphosulfolactate phosphatase n=1 Tax=Williamsia phyllosphaerae TaxID=885042 RepID=A0ABQ1UXX7_9NOCA|nr:2-phosphosulfolactate phosphatase [Williamsia phyllosphaerae]GGF28897.1 hypothetical protein GCM10007298_25930 [Williamsia phyllosphaerae]